LLERIHPCLLHPQFCCILGLSATGPRRIQKPRGSTPTSTRKLQARIFEGAAYIVIERSTIIGLPFWKG
jgi:hypothetical protein